jgi:hypothetical protein
LELDQGPARWERGSGPGEGLANALDATGTDATGNEKWAAMAAHPV